MPFMPSMRRSVMISDGRTAGSLASAASALSAVTGSKPAVCSRIDSSRSRWGSSSTTRIFLGSSTCSSLVAAAPVMQAALDGFQPFDLTPKFLIFLLQGLGIPEPLLLGAAAAQLRLNQVGEEVDVAAGKPGVVQAWLQDVLAVLIDPHAALGGSQQSEPELHAGGVTAVDDQRRLPALALLRDGVVRHAVQVPIVGKQAVEVAVVHGRAIGRLP